MLRLPMPRFAVFLAAALVLVVGAACRPGFGLPTTLSSSPSATPGATSGTILPGATQPVVAGGGELIASVHAGPTCPVQRQPPVPACADRPVRGAEVLILDATGHQVATATSGADGRFTLGLAAGHYQLVARPVGTLRAPPPVEVDVRAGVTTGPVDIAYDTGIR